MSTIETVLGPAKIVSTEKIFFVAASLLLLIHAGLYLGDRVSRSSSQSFVPSPAADRRASSVAPNAAHSVLDGSPTVDANGASFRPVNTEQPRASVFDTGAPPVPFLSPAYANSPGTFPGATAAPARGEPINPVQAGSTPPNEKTASIVSDDRARRLARKARNSSPASISDQNEMAAVSVPTDLAGWITALAGVDANHPDRFAPPPLDNDLRTFYRDEPTHPWLAQRLP